MKYQLLLVLLEFVGETRYALSQEAYVFPRAMGESSCAVAFWGCSSDGRMSFNPLHGEAH